MSVLSRQGVPAQGTSTVSVNRAVPVPLDGVIAGNPRWLTDTLLIFQAFIDGAWGLWTWDLAAPSAPLENVSTQGQNELFAGAHMWAANLNTGYRDARDLHEPAWAVLGGNGGYGVDNETGLVAVCPDRATGHGLSVWDGFALTAIETVQVQPEMCYRGGFLLYRLLSGVFKSWHHDEGHADPPSQVPVLGCWHSGIWRLGWQAGRGLVVFGWDQTEGLCIHDGGSLVNDFAPDIQTLEDGTVKVVSSRTTSQDPQDLQVYNVDVTAGTVNGQPREWVNLLAPPVTPEPPAVVPDFASYGRYVPVVVMDEPGADLFFLGVGQSGPEALDPRCVGVFFTVGRDDWSVAEWTALQMPRPTIFAYKDAPDYRPHEVPTSDKGITVLPLVQSYPIFVGPNPGDIEPLDRTTERIDASLEFLRDEFDHVAILGASYRQIRGDLATYNWPLQGVIDLLRWTSDQVIAHHLSMIGTYTWTRADGQDGAMAFPDLQTCVRRIQAASDPKPEPPEPPMPIVSEQDFKRHQEQTADITIAPQTIWPADMSRDDVINACGSWGNRSRANGVNAKHETMLGAYGATRSERGGSSWPTPMIDGSQAKYWDDLVKRAITLDKSEGL